MKIFERLKRKQEAQVTCAAVVVAAGFSTRMGTDKLMLPLMDIPVIVHTLKAVQEAPSIEEIVVVTREDLLVPIGQLCQDFGLSKVKKIIRGGSTRMHSVRLGTQEVSRDACLIAIHDGARPLVTVDVIEEAVEQARKSGAAAPAIPVKDTIKIAVNDLVEETLDRSVLRAVQTPQVFEASLIRAALQKAVEDGSALTDDCSAVERLGMKVVLTKGDERNIKITTPADLLLAESYLERSEAL